MGSQLVSQVTGQGRNAALPAEGKEAASKEAASKAKGGPTKVGMASERSEVPTVQSSEPAHTEPGSQQSSRLGLHTLILPTEIPLPPRATCISLWLRLFGSARSGAPGGRGTAAGRRLLLAVRPATLLPSRDTRPVRSLTLTLTLTLTLMLAPLLPSHDTRPVRSLTLTLTLTYVFCLLFC